MGRVSYGYDLLGILCPDYKPIWCSMVWVFQHLKGHKAIYTILSFFIVLALIYSILNGALQSLGAFLTRIIANPLLLIVNINAGKLYYILIKGRWWDSHHRLPMVSKLRLFIEFIARVTVYIFKPTTNICFDSDLHTTVN